MEESSKQYHERRFDTWIEHAINFFVLANAGAAVATLAFLGSREEFRGGAAALAVISLLCFVVGLVLAGTAIMGQLTGAYRAFLTADTHAVAADASIKKALATRMFDKAEPKTGSLLVASFALFVIGSVIGLLGLAAAVCSGSTS